MTPSISVVIPAFQAQPYIGRAVHSVLEQTRGDFEIVVVADDGSDYAALLHDVDRAGQRIRCVTTGGIGTGPANARNVGLDAAKGPIIAALDADDMLERTALERLVPLAAEHGAAYGATRFIDEETGVELESLDRVLPSGLLRLEDVLTSRIHTYSGIVVDRNRITARWPEWRELWEDVTFTVRCFDDVEAIYQLDEPLYRYHRVPGSLCNRAESGEEHLASARRLAARLEAGDTLGLRNADSRATFHRYLLSRQRLEEAFVRALENGTVSDFHAFISTNRGMLYRLDDPTSS